MTRRTPPLLAAVAAIALLTGCAASYSDRMKFLDKMNAAGIAYRQDLQRQDTQPDERACGIGWDLLKADIPADFEDGTVTSEWRDQVREAYMKGCLTGQERPKPDPSGVKAVTPVPIGSEGPRVPRLSSSGSATTSVAP